MDQTRVTSGYDVEVAMGGRYLQYLLLLALETGELPTEATFTPDGGGDPIKVELLVPSSVDRTYALDNGAPEPPQWVNNAPFMVEVLPTQAADVKVALFVRLTRGAQVLNADIGLFIGITIDSEPDTDGIGLGSITLKLELLDIDGTLVNLAANQTPPVPKSELLAKLQPVINRDLSMTDLGTGGRIELIHLKKLAADAEHEAALGLYINLILRAGPQEDNVLGPRGELTLAQNILEPGLDVTFATRASIYGDFAADAYHRMARRKGSGYHHPVMKKEEKIFDVVEIRAGPVQNGGTQLKVSVEGEYDLPGPIDPNFKVHIFVFDDVDADGIMSWSSDADVQASVLADIIIGVIALATVPLLGPYSLLVFIGLEAGKYVTEKLLAEYVVEDITDKKVDAALLDVAPNRFTIVSRRWDPFFTTKHQLGLRPGATLITLQGLALWGTVALTRALDPAKSIVIREAVRDTQGSATHLIYRVRGLAGSEHLAAVAPGMHRGPGNPPFTQPDPNTHPELFQLAVDDAIARIQAKELDGSQAYEVQAVEYIGNEVANMLVLSTREIDEQRNRLIGEATATAEAAAEAEDPIIRQEVADEFDAQGIIPTDEQVEAAVAAKKQQIVALAVTAYETNFLDGDLKAANRAAASFELSPNEFGRLQRAGLLKMPKYQLVTIKEDPPEAERYYYRDRYVPEEEPTTAARLADNLRNKPKYRNTSTGRVFA